MMEASWLKGRRYYLWIVLVGVVLRCCWAIAVPVIPVSDSNAYDTFAKNLANGLGYGWKANDPTAYWPVGTSFVYSLLYRVFGHTYWPIVVLHILLAVVTIGGAMVLAEKWFGRRVAAVTGLLLAVWPSQVQFTTVLASEQLFTALIVLALVVWLNEEINLWGRVGYLGVILAIASYVRPTALIIPVILLFLRYLATREILKNLAATAAMVALMALLIAPWSIRNTQEFGQFVTISTNGGANLWMGNSPGSTGEYMELPPEVNGMNEAQRDKYLKEVAKNYIKEKPLLFLQRCIKRVIDTHSRESISVGWNEAGLTARYSNRIIMPLKVLNQLYWLPVLGLGVVGIGVLAVQYGWFKMLTHPTVLFWGYFTAVHAVIVAQDRYHYPSIPMIAVLASVAIITGLDTIRKKKNQQELSS